MTKQTMKHTKGPWEGHKGVGRPFILSAGVRKTIAEIIVRPTKEETEANARLIAAAPEMLKALKFAFGIVEEYHWPPEVLRRMKEAIKQAEGK